MLSDPLLTSSIASGARSTSLLVADAGEAWRLLTCHFVHTSALHLGFNLAFLFPVGGAVEQVVARRDYVALMLAAAAGLVAVQPGGDPSGLGGRLRLGLRGARRGGEPGFAARRSAAAPDPHALRRLGAALPLDRLGRQLEQPGGRPWSHAGGLATGLLFGLALPLAGDRSAARLRVLATATVTVGLVVAAPAIAGRGGGPQRFALDDGSSVVVPSAWHPRYGPAGELQFTSAGGLVVLSTDHSPTGTWDERFAWYRIHRLSSLVTASNVSELRQSRLVMLDPAATPSSEAATLRLAYDKDGIAMVRDVFFLAPRTVLSLELPLAWADKYDETRTAIVGSIRPAPAKVPATASTAVAAAGNP